LGGFWRRDVVDNINGGGFGRNQWRRKKVVLMHDDIEGIQFLYGSNSNFNGSTATSTPDLDTSHLSISSLCYIRNI